MMSEVNYSRIISEVKALNLSDQLRLLEQMASIIRKNTSLHGTRSILELKGKGKDAWKGIDVKAYLDGERSSWKG